MAKYRKHYDRLTFIFILVFIEPFWCGGDTKQFLFVLPSTSVVTIYSHFFLHFCLLLFCWHFFPSSVWHKGPKTAYDTEIEKLISIICIAHTFRRLKPFYPLHLSFSATLAFVKMFAGGHTCIYVVWFCSYYVLATHFVGHISKRTKYYDMLLLKI